MCEVWFQVLTLSHGSVKMQHKQRLETQVLILIMNHNGGIDIDKENEANGDNCENLQLWGLDEETGCLRSKTSEYVSSSMLCMLRSFLDFYQIPIID